MDVAALLRMTIVHFGKSKKYYSRIFGGRGLIEYVQYLFKLFINKKLVDKKLSF